MASTSAGSSPTLADKLDQLFRTVRAADGREYSSEHVAAWIRERTGTKISTSYIYMLRRGERDNPTKSHIEGLAAFFGMPPAFFFDEALGLRMSEELELLNALRDSDVRAVAARTAQLTTDARRSVLAILREMSWARRPDAEGPDGPDGPGGPESADDRSGET